MKRYLSKELLDLKIGFDYLLESSSGVDFDIKHKILYLVLKTGKTSPKLLIEILGMAKSNLAIACTSLLKQGYLIKRKEESNKKEIYYLITTAGEQVLENKFKVVDESLAGVKNKDKIITRAQELSKMFDL